ncbi:Ku protein [Methylocapsa acidiphila]|uniref:non-homologous end joining protein Ku n=1 Tax=Methylocapsa acidiphila TaxID=133552 RepID=UPI0003FBEE9F|nr:Ku protein [Methylocapsa acidiphila]
MEQRPFWKGYLKLSLVTCPIALTPVVTAAERVQFHTLNRATGHRVASRYVDADTRETVEADDIVKGYQTGPDEYLALEDEELDSASLESLRTIDIESFVPRDSIDSIWFDRPHYVAPDDPVGEEAFGVIRDAMNATGTAAIARLVLYRRERAVMLHPHDRGLVLWTLRYGEEIRDSSPYFADIRLEDGEHELLDLFTTLIEKRLTPWKPSLASDPVQEHLLEIIAARKKGKRPRKSKATAPEPPTNVISIVEALRKSIAAAGRKR